MTCNGRHHTCPQCQGELSAPSWGDGFGRYGKRRRGNAWNIDGTLHLCYEGAVPVPNEKYFEKRRRRART